MVEDVVGRVAGTVVVDVPFTAPAIERLARATLLAATAGTVPLCVDRLSALEAVVVVPAPAVVRVGRVAVVVVCVVTVGVERGVEATVVRRVVVG